MSENENELVEYLITTRKRRTNAGNRLQKLLEQEIKDAQLQIGNFKNSKNFVNEDDDDINLLFQEDEDDQEFQVESDSISDNGSNVSSNKRYRGIVFQNVISDADDNTMDFQSNSKSFLSENNVDMMLSSDSDVESSNESDAEAGEKELQKEERLKKRKKRKVLPTIIKKTAKADESISSSAQKEEHTRTSKLGSLETIRAESLLTTARRTSNRSSTIANKIKVYEKLAKAEEKRRKIQLKLKKRRDENTLKLHKLTQDDRLRIAEETERLNLQSLNRFKEQEIFKKQTRLALQQRKKLKFNNDETVIQYLSTTWQVTPISELEDYKYWNEQLQKREKKKKKRYGRKPKKQLEDENNQKNLQPILSEEKEEENIIETNDSPMGQENDAISGGANTNIKLQIECSTIMQQETSNSKALDTVLLEKELQTSATALNSSVNMEIEDSTSTLSSNMPIEKDGVITKYNSASQLLSKKKQSFPEIPHANTKDEPLVISDSTTETATSNKDFSEHISIDSIEKKDLKVKEREEKQNKITKNYKKNQEETEITEEVEEKQDETKKGEFLQYEGPNQQVSKNFITVYKISTQAYNHISEDIPNYDFLPKPSIQTGKNKNQTELDTMKTILLSRLEVENNGQEIATDAAKLSVPSISHNVFPSLTFLDEFPQFGEFDKKIINQTDVMDIKVKSFKITTEAPMGIYINNIKKHCFINDNDCQYFDPKLGIPYSDLTSYRVIQDIQKPDGNYKWFGFENGGIYLNVNQRPAKGVPEGF